MIDSDSKFDDSVSVVHVDGWMCAVRQFGPHAMNNGDEDSRLRSLYNLGFSKEGIKKKAGNLPGEVMYYQIID